jgi:hypothetical protein
MTAPRKKLNELSSDELNELAASAKDLRNHPAFNRILDEIWQDSIQQLVPAAVGSLTASEAHATMKGIEAIRHRVGSYDIELKVRAKR